MNANKNIFIFKTVGRVTLALTRPTKKLKYFLRFLFAFFALFADKPFVFKGQLWLGFRSRNIDDIQQLDDY